MSEAHLAFRAALGTRVQLGVTGSVAAYKACDILRRLAAAGLSVGVTLTCAAGQFVGPAGFQALGASPVYTHMFPLGEETFGHLEPGQAAKAFLVAPATANCLAKMAHGLADDMLSTQLLAFPGPVLVAPAMNPRLWEAKATRTNWRTLLERGAIGIEPQAGAMACGESGQGRLADLRRIVLETLRAVTPQDLAGKRLLLTLGPTREPWDGVRFWSNPSTGLMGGSLAVAAWLRGASVTAVKGPCELWLPDGIEIVDVTTAREMHAACMDRWEHMDLGCLTAAVADFAPEPYGVEKFKKASLGTEGLTIRFSPNPDILRDLGARKAAHQKLIGFAAETGDLLANASAKLAAKNLDLIIANAVNKPGSGFGAPTNEVTVLCASGRRESWPCLPKPEVAVRIWDLVSML